MGGNRPVYRPLYPKEPDYMLLYRSWTERNEKAYREFVVWLNGMAVYCAELRRFGSDLVGMIKCRHSSFRSQCLEIIGENREWVDSVGAWIERVRVRLPDDEKRAGIMKEWDDWYGELEVWMTGLEGWFIGVDASLSILGRTVESQIQSFVSGLEGWYRKMEAWKDGWPTGGGNGGAGSGSSAGGGNGP